MGTVSSYVKCLSEEEQTSVAQIDTYAVLNGAQEHGSTAKYNFCCGN
ncbi:MAG TPA: hypothetical protein VKX41_10200 [Alloacidobacterium sp.]|jgi:hypothetical protein|nr:hypothetical protein [Alloacidobacterium sp.]